jgi:hypothetical protein
MTAAQPFAMLLEPGELRLLRHSTRRSKLAGSVSASIQNLNARSCLLPANRDGAGRHFHDVAKLFDVLYELVE